MAKLGFLGLGIMGGPMARHLLEAGNEVALWSHTASKAEQMAALGKGKVCRTPQEVAANATAVFLCVGDSAMSENVLTGPDGVLQGIQSGALVADCSTISPDLSREIGQKFAAKGAQYLDAPCTGSRAGAEGGTLTFMVGGDQKAFEQAKPFLEQMGKQIYYCGGPGLGLHAKLTQNLILANLMQAFNEGLVLSTKAGVDPELMYEILNNSAARSGLISAKAPAVFNRDFSTNFSTKWMHKDVGLMLDSGQQLGVPLPITALTRQMFQAAIAQGHGEQDFCSTIQVMEGLAGTEVKKSKI